MNKSTKDFRLGVTFALTNMFSLGILGIIDKIGATQTNITPLIFSTQSILFALLYIVTFALLYQKGAFITDLKKTSLSVWKRIFFVGVFAGGIFILLRFLGLTQSTGTFATLSQILITSLTALLAFFFLKEKLSKKFWLLFVTILIATYFVSIGAFKLTSLQIGDNLLIIGTIFVAIANILSKQVINHTTPLVLSFGRFFFGGLFLLLVSLFFFGGRQDLFTFTIWSAASGLFWTINTTSFNFAIQKIGVTLAISILMLAPVVTMILEFTILKQTFNPIQIVAAFVVIFCGILIVRNKEN